MTIKSYYANNRIYDFEANIINITQENEDFLVELDSTYFYPEGGGQPSDKGTIGGVRVLDVIKSDDTVLHKLKTRPSKTTLNCSINKEHRDHYMTQHSGQHLISGVLKHSLNIDTLSVHLGEYETTIEIDKASISESEITKLEDDCNALIRSSKNIIYHETDDDGLKEFNIRRSSKYSGYIRVVEIENYDFVPCGGVHLSNLSEIGLIKVTGLDKIRGHIRLSFAIGSKAYSDYRKKQNVIQELNSILSTKTDGILAGVNKLKKDISELKIENNSTNKVLIQMLKDSILKDNIIIKEFQNMPKVIIQKLSTELVGLLDKPILLINCTERLNWVFIDSKKPQIDFYQIKNNLLPIIKGKGGGKKLIWQGSGEIENKKEFSEKTKNYLTKLI